MRSIVRSLVAVVAVALLPPGPAASAQDPVEVDPEHYSVELENDRVRVLRVRYPAGAGSVMHEHPDLVAVMLTDGSFEMTVPGTDGPLAAPMEAGAALWDESSTHRPKNAGDAPAELILVELKPAAGAETANVELLRGAYQAFGRGDVPGVLAILHPQVEWTEAAGHPYAGTFVGPDAVLANVFQPIGRDWSSFTVTPSAFVADGDRVVVLGDYAATHAKTGKSFQAPFAHSWQVADGKVVRFRQFTDTEPVVAAAGGIGVPGS